jgi:exopolysaccharide biosynthesis polyprenyl glycosylphosphotransferase
MLRYTEADELSAGGRVLVRRETSTSRSAGAGAAPLLIDLRGPDDEPVLVREPRSAVPQQDRRAVGRVIRVVGNLIDASAFALPMMLNAGRQNDVAIEWDALALFSLVGMLLLWTTARRGRLAVPASEGLIGLVARIGLTPVVTLVIASGYGWFRNLIGSPIGDGSEFGIDPVAIVWIVCVTLPFVLLGRLFTYQLVGRARSRGYDLEDTLVVGSGPVGVQVARALAENPGFGLVPCGFVDRYENAELPLPVVGRPQHLPEILRLTGVRHVVLAFGAADDPELVGIVRRCHELPVQFYAVPRLFELGVSAEDVGHEVSGLPLVPLRRPAASASFWPAKRVLDIVTASVLLVLASPILLACALAVKLTSRGPVYFRQVRIGVGGRPFEILKFRTMVVNDDSATQWSVDDDERVTRVGQFLRPSHLDELPQLFNVLKGEMSLVGPRPERPHFVEQFGQEIDGYHFRHRVPVGMTGWALVNGYWGDTSIETRVRLDNRYIENWSLWRDLVIGLRTIPTLLGKRR